MIKPRYIVKIWVKGCSGCFKGQWASYNKTDDLQSAIKLAIALNGQEETARVYYKGQVVFKQ